MKNKKFELTDYYVGLDIGTDSIGFAATDTDYNILKQNQKSLWGVRLFDGGKTAEERRMFRGARRRLARKKARIELLQEIFDSEITAIDETFFKRLKESKYVLEDKTTNSIFTLFNDAHYTDKDFYKQFPTNYHLRNFLIQTNEPYDIRLLYLGLHNIIKRRGHFLTPGNDLTAVTSFELPFNALCDYISDNELDYVVTQEHAIEIQQLLKNKNAGISEKERTLKNLFGKTEISTIAALKLACGGTVELKNLFYDDSLSDAEIKKVSFAVTDFETTYCALSEILADKVELIALLKSLYDWSILSDILKGNSYLSKAKIETHQMHAQDIKELKALVKKYLPDKKSKILRYGNVEGNYAAYARQQSREGAQYFIKKYCTQIDFCSFLKKELKNINPALLNEEEKALFSRIENNTFAPKQLVSENATIPKQVHETELKAILKNAAQFFPFLNVADDTGFTPTEKIIKTFNFRVPYYIGPLNNAHSVENGGHAWIVKRSNEQIRPWNFDAVVDDIASAEKFIQKMTSRCTYLIGADVLPKQSLLYANFMVLNELNNLTINGEKVSCDTKKIIFDELFHTERRVTQTKLKNFLYKKEILTKVAGTEPVFGGIDGDFKSSLTAYHDFKNILNKTISTEVLEDLIQKSTILGEDKKMFARFIEKQYPTIINDDKKVILSKRYQGWGKLSKEFLTEIYYVEPFTGECKNVITMLYETNKNLMELFPLGFNKAVEDYNNGKISDKKGYQMLDDLYVSPKVKRSIWQTVQIVKELEKITGHAPAKIFVETTRGVDDPNNVRDDKNRSVKRKKQLTDLYAHCKKEERDWLAELNGKTDRNFQSDRLFLYYTQKGQCMYCGKQMAIDTLMGDNAHELYDIDHIYPRAKTKDDSLNNRVLVCRNCNKNKKDIYPLTQEIRTNRHDYWKMLLDKNFISKEKYTRLTRSEPLSEKELADFINRQLVETGQSTKAVCELFKNIYGENKVVYVKAKNVSEFRQEYNMIKCRNVNDYHHAKDAYLNIVVGNVYHKKFTRNPINFVKDAKLNYSLKTIFKYDIEDAWHCGENGTLQTVKNTLKKNNIMFTRYVFETTGGFAKQQLKRKGFGQMPAKPSDPLLQKHTQEEVINRYGGYDSVYGAYFALIEYDGDKAKRVRSFEFVPVHISNNIGSNKNKLLSYFAEKGFVNPRILIAKVKTNTLFYQNGFYMHLSGRTGNQLDFKNANQLLLSASEEQYIKKLANFCTKQAEARRTKTAIKVEKLDKITKEENLNLYKLLTGKLENTVYNVRLSSQVEYFKTKQNNFEALAVEQQAEFLINALNLFACNSASADLSLIHEEGKNKSVGNLRVSKYISNDSTLAIIHQSITGFYQTAPIVLSKL